MRCSFVPPYLLDQIARAPGLGVTVDPDLADRASVTLAVDAEFRAARETVVSAPSPPPPRGGWLVHTADHGSALPGRPVRSDSDLEESGDEAVDEAWAGVRASLALFREVYGRASYDDADARVLATVHFQRDYENAFWDGSRLVFGDGDRRIFDRFTKPVDVLAHEFTHAVTEHAAGLVYHGQSGALNESVSDVFAACLRQRLLDQSATEADWLIGEGLFLPGVNARALRDMASPGTAYDDTVLGRDPQAAHMDSYIRTEDDNGGVHLNSGIPNRAFHLAATAIGGASWEGAGRIWYAALTGDLVHPRSDFGAFAAATVAAAGRHAGAVRDAWEAVGVQPEGRAAEAEAREPEVVAHAVVVSRSGGFAGRTTTGAVDLAGDDEVAAEVRDLLHRVDLSGVTGGPPMPDMFVYTFEVPGRAPVQVPEQQLTDELRDLARLVLPGPPGQEG